MPRIPGSLFGCCLLGSFNGPETSGLESMIRKWKRELEWGREREIEREKERKKERERKTWGSKLWWSKSILLAEMQAYIALVRWLLSYYTGWNFINSYNMDNLIHTRSLVLKSHWRELLKGIHADTVSHDLSVLRAVCSSTRSWNRNR